MKEVVAEAGSQSIPIQEPEDPASRLETTPQAEGQAVAAFDGVGGSSDNYTPAQVSSHPHQRMQFKLPHPFYFRSFWSNTMTACLGVQKQRCHIQADLCQM